MPLLFSAIYDDQQHIDSNNPSLVILCQLQKSICKYRADHPWQQEKDSY